MKKECHCRPCGASFFTWTALELHAISCARVNEPRIAYAVFSKEYRDFLLLCVGKSPDYQERYNVPNI